MFILTFTSTHLTKYSYYDLSGLVLEYNGYVLVGMVEVSAGLVIYLVVIIIAAREILVARFGKMYKDPTLCDPLNITYPDLYIVLASSLNVEFIMTALPQF